MRRYGVIFLILLFFVSSGESHPGRTNASGCHAGSRPFHCHGSGTVHPSRSSGWSNSGDKDCADFDNWRQAQDFYKKSGPRDPHRLDRDKDGIACESLR